MVQQIALRENPLTIRKIDDDRPWHWLQAGWNDLLAAPRVSLAYGAVVSAASWLLFIILQESDWLYLLLPLAGGFLLIAPFVAVGLYETSRRLDSGEPISLRIALLAWRRPVQVASFGILLLLLHFAWMRAALLWFVLYFHTGTPPLDQLPLYLLDAGNLPFLVIGTLMGGAFALLTFSLSVVSLPLLVDRDIDVISAGIASIRAVLTNPKAMLLWAGLIVLFTAVGIATFFFGLALLFPLIGHASWHAYKDLID
jgi:uncharacterized membrane protein